MKPKEIVIGTPPFLCPWLRKKKTSPFRGLDLTPLVADIALAGLSEVEQLSLALKAFIDTIREERAAGVASLLRLTHRYSVCFPFFRFLYCTFFV